MVLFAARSPGLTHITCFPSPTHPAAPLPIINTVSLTLHCFLRRACEQGNDKGKPLKYEGARELDDLVDYIKEHATNKFSHDEL